MQETTCDALYRKLLRTVSRKDDGMGWSSYSQLKNTLERWNPKLLKEPLRPTQRIDRTDEACEAAADEPLR